jgi:hypothetical protein
MKRSNTSKSTDLNALTEGLLRLDKKKVAFDKSADKEIHKLEKQLLKMKSSTDYDWDKLVDWDSSGSSSEFIRPDIVSYYFSIASKFKIDEVKSLAESDLILSEALHELAVFLSGICHYVDNTTRHLIEDYKFCLNKEEEYHKEKQNKALKAEETRKTLIEKQRIVQEEEARAKRYKEKNEQLITKRRRWRNVKIMLAAIIALALYKAM